MSNFLENYQQQHNGAAVSNERTILPYQRSSIINCVSHLNYDRYHAFMDKILEDIDDSLIPANINDPADTEEMTEIFVNALEIAFDSLNRSRGLRKIYKRTEPLLNDHSIVYDIYANINGACSIRIIPVIGYSKGVQRKPYQSKSSSSER